MEEKIDSRNESLPQRLVNNQHFFSHITENQLDKGYAIAYQLYAKKQYDEACQFFRVLVQVCPKRPQFWKGFGASLQMLQMYEEAIDCYSAAQILNGSKPDLYLYVHLADCYLALKQIENGLKTLNLAEKHAKEIRNKAIVNHVIFMRSIWEKTLKNKNVV